MFASSKLKLMLFRIALLCLLAFNIEASTPPLIDYVTYLGGSYADAAAGIAVDSTGAAYVAGTTLSPDFPVTSTSLGAPSTNSVCSFVTKLNPSGTAIDFSVCLANLLVTAFALDANGNMYLGSGDSVVKLDPAAQNILYTLPTGGSVESLAVDAAGDVYSAGTAGPGLTTTAGVYQSQSAGGVSCPSGLNGPEVRCNNAFITKLSPSGNVVWSTYLGGFGPDDAHAIAVDSAGNVWAAGETLSPNFPTTAGAISRTFQGEVDLGPLRYGDAFVAKLDPTGSHLLYSSYLGGSGPDGAFSLALDGTGAVYVAGGTGSPNFPTTPGALQTTYTGYDPNIPPGLGPDGFITKLDASGDLIYSTLTASASRSIVADASGQLYVGVSGDATSSTIQPSCATPQTVAVSVINSAGSAVVASSPIPGAYLALDGKGGLYSSGLAQTPVFFSTPHAFQTEYGGGNSDAFAAKVDFSQPAGPSIASVLNAASLFPGFATNFPTGAVAPGEIVTIFGNDFGAAQPSVNFGQFPAPVLYHSTCQINTVVPFEVNQLPTTLVTVQLGGENGEQTLGPIKLPVVVAAPGIFTANASGSGQAAVLNQDSSVNSSSNPAARGSTVSVYLTGTGALNPAIADGSLGPMTAPFPAPVAGISATIGGVDAPVTFAGQAPGLIAGATQVNIQIPQYAPFGAAVAVIIYAGGYASTYTNTITLAIR
jgi:uncharacterized protein (TIGR03437 family)